MKRCSGVRRPISSKPETCTERCGENPTLTDRLIQQALHQVLSPIFEADFSESSYGFRPGGLPIRRSRRRSGMSPKAGALWWIWIWRSSSTGSITTF